MSKFFNFSQNNSGGSFDYDESAGITHYVIVEAVNSEDAVNRAEAIGLYFYGCQTGQDCECCGDRWSTPYDEGEDFPAYYGDDVRSNKLTGWTWRQDGKEICVHYMNGTKEWHIVHPRV